jgi:hypothetical protein
MGLTFDWLGEDSLSTFTVWGRQHQTENLVGTRLGKD